MRSTSAIFIKPLCVYHKSSPYAVAKKRMGDQRSTKYDASTVAPAVGEKAHLETKRR